MLAQKISWLRKSQKKFPVLDSDQAGTLGESLAFEQLRSVIPQLHSRGMIFRSLRVPKRQGPGKYEIDLVLVTARAILVIEVKHWGGSLSQAREGWMQERGNERKALPDPVKLNQDKMLSLRHWLAQKGFTLPQAAMRSLVVLTHTRVTISAELKKTGSVVDSAKFQAEVIQHCGLPKRAFWQKKPDPAFDFSGVVNTLQQLPTWDRLELHGGRVLFGDLSYVSVPEVKPSALQRKYMQSALVLLSRRMIPGLFLKARLQIRDWNGQRQVYALHPDARLVFRLAGQNVEEEIPWVHVESLQLGWKDQSYYD